jgi:hypothetical protein
MAWICRLCGGELRVIVTRNCSDTHNIERDGAPSERRSRRDLSGEIIGTNLFCKKCGIYHKTKTKIETVGVWKE